jgi:hypothetical protein
MKSRWNWGSITCTFQNIPLINGHELGFSIDQDPSRAWTSIRIWNLHGTYESEATRVRRALRSVRIRIYHLAVFGSIRKPTFLMRYQAFFKFTLELTVNIGFVDPDQVRPDLWYQNLPNFCNLSLRIWLHDEEQFLNRIFTTVTNKRTFNECNKTGTRKSVFKFFSTE